MSCLSLAVLPAALFLLTSCGSLTTSQQKALAATVHAYGQIHHRETRASAKSRLGPPQRAERRQDEWKYAADDTNGESLLLDYDRRNLIIDGGRCTWRGDQRGLVRWGRETSYYLPHLPPHPTPEALRSRSVRGQIKL